MGARAGVKIGLLDRARDSWGGGFCWFAVVEPIAES